MPDLGHTGPTPPRRPALLPGRPRWSPFRLAAGHRGARVCRPSPWVSAAPPGCGPKRPTPAPAGRPSRWSRWPAAPSSSSTSTPSRRGSGSATCRDGLRQSRSRPNTDLAIAVAAREAELELLDAGVRRVQTGQNRRSTSAPTRDLLARWTCHRGQYRYSHRIPHRRASPASSPWAQGPDPGRPWREVAHDNPARSNVLAITDAQIDDWFAARDINVIWTLDGQGRHIRHGRPGDRRPVLPAPSAGPAPSAWPGQIADAPSCWPGCSTPKARSSSSTAGAWTSASCATRRWTRPTTTRPFETFECVAVRGLEVYQVTVTVLPNGGTAGTVAATSYHEQATHVRSLR